MGTGAVRHLLGAGTPEPPKIVVRQAIRYLAGALAWLAPVLVT